MRWAPDSQRLTMITLNVSIVIWMQLDNIMTRLCKTVGAWLRQWSKFCNSNPPKQWLFEPVVEEHLDGLQSLCAHCLPTWLKDVFLPSFPGCGQQRLSLTFKQNLTLVTVAIVWSREFGNHSCLPLPLSSSDSNSENLDGFTYHNAKAKSIMLVLSTLP